MLVSKCRRRPAPAVQEWVCNACQIEQRRRARAKFSTKSYSRATASQDGVSGKPKNPPRDWKLPKTPARTRFAPSPTGYMHIGGLRTALFSYLLAKKTNGQFLLRIEDTDQKRLVSDAEQRLCDDLHWAGLDWDEGPQVGGPHGPYKQSERTEIYQQHAEKLLDADTAFRCFCSPQTNSHDHAKVAYVSSGCYQDCASLPQEVALDRAKAKREPFTIRLRQPADVHKRKYTDLIYGKIQRLKRSPSSAPSGEDDATVPAADTILVKSDGTPTYHFANVVDDHLMKITHVIRGTEWMASTPLHFDLYTAFGWEPPTFAHVGLLLDETGAKLSKRSSTGLVLDVKAMREEQGILPRVLCNFLALLGWSNPGRDDVLEMHELIRDFDLKFTKGNTVVKMEKLWYLQKNHVARPADAVFVGEATDEARQFIRSIAKQIADQAESSFGSNMRELPSGITLQEYCENVLLADSRSYSTPAEYVNRNRYFFSFDSTPDPQSEEGSKQEGVVSLSQLSKFSADLLRDFDWTRPYQDPIFPSPSAASVKSHAVGSPPRSDLQIKSTRIHAAITHLTWKLVCCPEHYNAATEEGSRRITTDDLPFTDLPIDTRQYSSFFASKGDSSDPTTPDAVEKRYKAVNLAIMHYLRERLTHGLPGPGIGKIMAVLGYKECCRRFGVEPSKGEDPW